MTRVLFKAPPDTPVYLYYGNHEAVPPRYDVSLVAAQMLAADKTAVSPGTEEQLKKSSWREPTPLAGSGVIFWTVLGLVVVVLLFVIARLLPKNSPPPAN